MTTFTHELSVKKRKKMVQYEPIFLWFLVLLLITVNISNIHRYKSQVIVKDAEIFRLLALRCEDTPEVAKKREQAWLKWETEQVDRQTEYLSYHYAFLVTQPPPPLDYATMPLSPSSNTAQSPPVQCQHHQATSNSFE